MKTIIIDDEQTSIDALTQKLQSYDDITIAGTAQSGLKGIVLVRNAQPDLLFIPNRSLGPILFSYIKTLGCPPQSHECLSLVHCSHET